MSIEDGRVNVISQLEESGRRYDIDAVVAALEINGLCNIDVKEQKRDIARDAIRIYRKRVKKSQDFQHDFLNLWERVFNPETGKEQKRHYYKGGHATTLEEDRQYKSTLEKAARTNVAKLQEFCDHCIKKHGQKRLRFFKFDETKVLRDEVAY